MYILKPEATFSPLFVLVIGNNYSIIQCSCRKRNTHLIFTFLFMCSNLLFYLHHVVNRVKHMRYPAEKTTKGWLYLICFVYTKKLCGYKILPTNLDSSDW